VTNDNNTFRVRDTELLQVRKRLQATNSMDKHVNGGRESSSNALQQSTAYAAILRLLIVG
jgi:hypothetical protein